MFHPEEVLHNGAGSLCERDGEKHVLSPGGKIQDEDLEQLLLTLRSPHDSPGRWQMGLSFPPWALPLRETAGLSLGEFLSESATAADSAFCFMAWSILTSFSLSMRKAA